MDMIEQLASFGVIPVVVPDDPSCAAPLANALREGGLPCAEITLRTPAALETIRAMHAAAPDFLIGAGTVLSPAAADEAIAAGASFIVSPGYNPHTVDHCIKKGYPVVPGINNASGIEQALEAGLTAVKFFPAEASGGVAMLKALAAPYPMMRFMPTGGVSASNLKDYLALPSVFCCGGSWMVKGSMLKAGQYDEILRLTKEAVHLTKEQ